MTMADNPAWIFLITTSCFILGVSAQVQSRLCQETCIDLTCEDPGTSKSECTYGCVDGYWGTYCTYRCPVKCATCHRQYGGVHENRVCYTCQDGFYNDATVKQCTLACLLRCRTCSNNESNCTACPDGFYLDNSQCKPCPERCAECTSDLVCTACANEYYSGTLCEECVVGRFGDMCESDCPERCSQCTSDHLCTVCAREYYTGAVCEECVDGRLGDMCESDAAASTSAGTIAGIAVGVTIGLVIIVLLIVIIVLMYKRYDQTRAKMRKTDDNDVDPPRNIYDDLKMEGVIGSSGDYDSLGEESGINDTDPGTDETNRHQYTNIAI